jgi:NAD(P)H-dependent FMN reductase
MCLTLGAFLFHPAICRYPAFIAPIESNEPWLSSSLEVVGEAIAGIERAGIPAARIALLGFSQGACLALEYAARNARRWGGGIGFSGGLIGPDGTSRDYGGSLDGTPVFLGCSDVDPHIPINVTPMKSLAHDPHAGLLANLQPAPAARKGTAGDDCARCRPGDPGRHPAACDRRATRASLAAAPQAREIGAVTSLLDLRDYDLPLMDARKDDDAYPPDVTRLRFAVREAQGIILGTPEYHGGFSGVLKNALDLMGFEEFEGKMLGLIGVSAGRMGAVNALNSLRTVGRSLHAWVVPEQASVPEAGATSTIRPCDRRPAQAEARRQAALPPTSEQALEFLRLWEQATENPGG